MNTHIEDEDEEIQQDLKHIDSVQSEVAEKLRKMVALAHDAQKGDRQGEFEAAMQAAVRYSRRHSIDLSSIDPEDATKAKSALDSEPFVNHQFKAAKGGFRRPPAHKFIVAILIDFFNVEVVQGIGSNSSMVWLIGRKSHAEFGEWLYFHLNHQFCRFWRKYKNDNGCLMSDRASYFYGLWCGLRQKLHEASEEGKAEAIKELASRSDESKANECYTITIVKESEKREQAKAGYHPVLLKSKTKFQSGVDFYSDSFSGGIRDGKKLQIAKPLSA